ncbi:hypothetical protein ACKKBG_A28390 [Auxenochlorella protothecoides x Auxenochlorella symbiontica]
MQDMQPSPEELTSSTFLTHGDQVAPGSVALCLAVRDAHEDILEWLLHHKRLGVTRVYLWDNKSVPPMNATIEAHIASGFVAYNYFDRFTHPTGAPQLFAYDRCLEEGRPLHAWMGFIDVDEFLIFRGGAGPIRNLGQYLSTKHSQAAGLAVHWILFGSSGHMDRPASGVLRSFVKCLPLRHAQHQLVKTIVRLDCTAAAWSPHAFHHNCSGQSVARTDGSPIEGPRAEEPTHVDLALHHYATKSRRDFEQKMVRGSGMKRQRGWEYFNFVDSWSVVWNFDALRIWDDGAIRTIRDPAAAAAALEQYRAEMHEDHWLKGP